MSRWRKHIVVPDTQVRPGIRLNHLAAIGRYIAEKRPDVVVHLGDHYDMPSLCEYERKKPLRFFSRRVERDIAAGNEGLTQLTEAIRKNAPANYRPRLILLRGNHEDRLTRLILEDPRLDGLIGEHLFCDRALGWQVVPYLRPIVLDGVAYCHQFVKSTNGRVSGQSTKWGAPNARAQVLREMRSCTAGHKPGCDFHIQPGGGKSLYGLIAGSCYQHDEDYLTPQGTRYWRGIVVKHEVRAGEYDPMMVSLTYLLRRYS